MRLRIMARICIASAIGALVSSAFAIPLPDRLSNLESREEFRQRTKEVFEAKKYHHKRFEEKIGGGFDSPEKLTTRASIYYDAESGEYSIKEGASRHFDGSLAKAAFMNTAEETGWGRLSIIANPEGSRTWEDQGHVYYGVGYLEGYLTCDYIAKFYKNYYQNTFDGEAPGEDLVAFVEANDKWLRSNVEKSAQADPYWRQVGSILRQFDGLVDGYNAGCGAKSGEMKPIEFKFMNMNGDLFDIKAKFPTKKEEAKNQAIQEEDVFIPTHCSALIKVLPDYSDVFVAHATWDTYSNIYPRIYKHVSVPVVRFARGTNEPEYVQHRVHYSSMPGYLASVDDFYVTKGTNELSTIETSITLYNKDLLKAIVPEAVLCWMRVMLSNTLAYDGEDWTRLFALHNSGTYNNEWMVTDFTKFNPGAPPSKGFFHVLNQLPGHVVTKDMTDRISSDLYYGSYNIPVHESVWEKAGYANKAAKSTDPAQFSYDECPRALQFRRLHKDVKTDADMGWIIGWNDIPTSVDEMERRQLASLLNRGNDVFDDVYDEDYPFTPANAIAARCDLPSAVSAKNDKVQAYGAIDGKVASFTSHMIETPVQWARAGPTFDEQPVFCWTEQFSNSTVHAGHPECYNWEWQPMRAHDLVYVH